VLNGVRALGELPLSCLASQVNIIVLTRVLIKMGYPSFRQGRRRSRASSCEIWGQGHHLSMLSTGLWSGIIGKCRVTLIMRSSCRSKAGGGSSRSSGRSCSHHCLFSWCCRAGGHRGLSSRSNRSSCRCLISLLRPLFLIWIRGSSARVHTGVGWRGRAGAQALEILFQNTDLSGRVDLILCWLLLLLLLLLRRRAADWMLRLRGRNLIHTLVHSRRTRRSLVWRLCGCPRALRLRRLIAILCQSLRSSGTLNLRSLKTGESCRAGNARCSISGLNAAARHAPRLYYRSLWGWR
jgi:hypothetical protein